MLLSNKMTVTIWLNLLRFDLRIWLLPPWILPSAAIAFPASVTKKLPCWERWDDSHFLIYHPCRHLLFGKIILVPYVDTNAKVTDFLPFCAIGISVYQKMLSRNLTPSLRTTSYVHESRRWQPLSPFLHYQNQYVPNKYLTLYIIPYLFTPSLFSFGAFQTDWLTDRQDSSPLVP